MAPSGEAPAIVIVGAGVIGLTTAVVLRERGHRVLLLGRELPADATSQHFASVWAGANWCSYAGPHDVREQRWETKTWECFLDVRRTRPDLVALIPFLQFLPTEVKKESLWFSSLCPNFEIKGRIPDGFGEDTFALSYDSLAIHVPHYLDYLVQRATVQEPSSSSATLGPPVEIHRIPSLSSLASALDFLPSSFNKIKTSASAPIIVNATGLGARELIDVLDDEVHPARGQTVLIRAPRVKRCVVHAGKESKLSPGLPHDGPGPSTTLDAQVAKLDIQAVHQGGTSPSDKDPDADQPSYVIPRALSGDVILGGTYQEDRWVYAAEERTTLRILDHCHKICPEIATPFGEHAYRLRRPIEDRGAGQQEGQQADKGDTDSNGQSRRGRRSQDGRYPPTDEDVLVWSPAHHPTRLLTPTQALNHLQDDDEAVEIVRVNVGMRPARRGGVRLERDVLLGAGGGEGGVADETDALGSGSGSEGAPTGTRRRAIRVVHAYGLGPAGYQQSWGVAHGASDLVEQAVAGP